MAVGDKKKQADMAVQVAELKSKLWGPDSDYLSQERLSVRAPSECLRTNEMVCMYIPICNE
jgi:hypothetical protein